MLKINGEILSAEMEIRMVRAVAGSIGHVAGESRPAFIIDQRGRPGVPEDIDLRAEGAGEAGGNLAHPRLHPLLDFAAMGAQRTFQLDAFRQDIPRIATLNPRDAQHHGIEGVHFAAGDALQQGHQLAGQQNGVLPFMRPGGVSAFAGHLKHKAIDVGVKRAASGGEFAHRQTRFIMHTENGGNALQHAGANQGFRAAEALLRRLEQNTDASRQLRFALFQQ